MTNKYFIEKWNSLAAMEDRLVLLKKTILKLFVNKELILFLDKFIKSVSDQNEKRLILLFAKKTISQFPRKPEEDFLKAFEEELCLNSDAFLEEQKDYDPVNWIDCELKFIEELTQLKLYEVPLHKIHTNDATLEKELLTQKETLALLNISKSTLDRRRWDGLPFIKKGKKIYFRKTDVSNWLNTKN